MPTVYAEMSIVYVESSLTYADRFPMLSAYMSVYVSTQSLAIVAMPLNLIVLAVGDNAINLLYVNTSLSTLCISDDSKFGSYPPTYVG